MLQKEILRSPLSDNLQVPVHAPAEPLYGQVVCKEESGFYAAWGGAAVGWIPLRTQTGSAFGFDHTTPGKAKKLVCLALDESDLTLLKKYAKEIDALSEEHALKIALKCCCDLYFSGEGEAFEALPPGVV